MSKINLKENRVLGVASMFGVFALIYYLLYSVLSRLQLGDITLQVFILLLLLWIIRPRPQPIVMVPPNPFGMNTRDGHENMEVA